MTKCDELPEEEKKRRYQEKKRLAEEIYETRIRHLIGPEDEDKYVKIDVTTGDYEIHENSIVAGRNLLARHPDAVVHTMQRHQTRVIRIRSPIRLAGKTKASQ